MSSPPDAPETRGARRVVLALAAASVSLLASCGLEPPPTPPPFHCEDYDMASDIFFATCAPDAGADDAGADDAATDDGATPDGGP